VVDRATMASRGLPPFALDGVCPRLPRALGRGYASIVGLRHHPSRGFRSVALRRISCAQAHTYGTLEWVEVAPLSSQFFVDVHRTSPFHGGFVGPKTGKRTKTHSVRRM
jgi:hypothetical protein